MDVGFESVMMVYMSNLCNISTSDSCTPYPDPETETEEAAKNKSVVRN